MSTTALLVEILIIGFEVILWMLLIVNLLAPESVGRWLDRSGNNALVEAGALAAAAYVLGIVADKTAKWIVETSSQADLFTFKPETPEAHNGNQEESATASKADLRKSDSASLLERLLRPRAPALEPEVVGQTLEAYAAVVTQKGEPMSDLLYGRSKVRILRASIFNVPIIVLGLAGAAMITELQDLQLYSLLLAAAIGLAGLVLALLLARYFNWLYCYNLWLYRVRLTYFYDSLQPPAPGKSGQKAKGGPGD